jgi:hypothetical protein
MGRLEGRKVKTILPYSPLIAESIFKYLSELQ